MTILVDDYLVVETFCFATSLLVGKVEST